MGRQEQKKCQFRGQNGLAFPVSQKSLSINVLQLIRRRLVVAVEAGWIHQSVSISDAKVQPHGRRRAQIVLWQRLASHSRTCKDLRHQTYAALRLPPHSKRFASLRTGPHGVPFGVRRQSQAPTPLSDARGCPHTPDAARAKAVSRFACHRTPYASRACGPVRTACPGGLDRLSYSP